MSYGFFTGGLKLSLATVVGRKNNKQMSLLLVGDDGLRIESYSWEASPRLIEVSKISCRFSRNSYLYAFHRGYLVLFSLNYLTLLDIENSKLIASHDVTSPLIGTLGMRRLSSTIARSEASIFLYVPANVGISGKVEIYLSVQSEIYFWAVHLSHGKLFPIASFKSQPGPVLIRRISEALCVIAHRNLTTVLHGSVVVPRLETLSLSLVDVSVPCSYRYLEPRGDLSSNEHQHQLLRIDDFLRVSIINLTSLTIQSILDVPQMSIPQYMPAPTEFQRGAWKLGTSFALGPCIDSETAKSYLHIYSYRSRSFTRLENVSLAFYGAPIYWDEESEGFVVLWDKEINNGCRKMTFWRFY